MGDPVEADEVEHQLSRRAILKVGHLVVRHDRADHAHGTVAVAQFIARLDGKRVGHAPGGGLAEENAVFCDALAPGHKSGK